MLSSLGIGGGDKKEGEGEEKKEGEKKEGEEGEKKEGEEGEKEEEEDNRTPEEKAADEARLKDRDAAQAKAHEALLKKKAEMASQRRLFKFLCQNIVITNEDSKQHDPFIVFRVGRNRRTETVQGKKKKVGARGRKFVTEKFKKMPGGTTLESKCVFKFDWRGYYKDLEEQFIFFQVWDWDRWTPNDLVAEHKISMEQLANSSVNQEIEFVVEDDGTEIPYLTLKCQIMFDEVFPWELMFTDWIGAGLKPADMVDGVPTTSDPYTVFSIPRARRPFRRGYRFGRTVRTDKVRSTLYPVWDDISTPLYYTGTRSQLDNEVLIVNVFDWDLVGRDDLIGQARIPLNGVLDQGFVSVGLALEEDEMVEIDDGKKSKGKKKKKKKSKKSKVGKGGKDDKQGKKGKKGKKDDDEPKRMKKTGKKVWNDWGLVQGYIKPAVTPLHQQMGLPVIRRPDVVYLAVKIEQAEQLKAADLSGMSDPFFALEWDGSRLLTTVQYKKLNPKFHETLYFGVKAAKITEPVLRRKGPVKVMCFDWDESGSNDFLGGCELGLDRITSALPVKGASETRGRMFSGKIPLVLPGIKSEASVTLKAWFEPDLPPDLQIQAVEKVTSKTLPKPFTARQKEWKGTIPSRNLQNSETQKYRVGEVDEENNMRFLCSYLTPMTPPKEVLSQPPTPLALARMTRLLTFSPDSENVGVEKEFWVSPNFFMDMKKGDADAHSVFLCNLFLGMGLDAFVCVGALRGHKKQHQWVMTRERDGSVLFWETMKGTPYTLPGRWDGDPDNDEENVLAPPPVEKKEEVEDEEGGGKRGLFGRKKKAKKRRRRVKAMTRAEKLVMEEKQAKMVFLDDDEVIHAAVIRHYMQPDPEARGMDIELSSESEEEEVVVEDWAKLPPVNLPYESLDLVFNRTNIWGNRGHPNPGRVFFDLDNSEKWTPYVQKNAFEPEDELLDDDGNFKVFYAPRPVLGPPPAADKLKAFGAEVLDDLRSAITNYRDDKNLDTEFVDEVAPKIATALERLEKFFADRRGTSRNAYVSAKNRIRAECPKDHLFTAVPVCFAFSDIKEIRKYILAEFKYHDDSTPNLKFALGVKAIGYPMAITAVWVMYGTITPK